MPLRERNRSRLATDTAEGMAALRAAGAAEADPCVRNPDYLAAGFVAVRPKLTVLVRIPLLRGIAPRIAERLLPGGYWSETARVRHIDEVLVEELEAGIAQLVILGAGFDTRAHRFEGKLRDVHVYEVDHPATGRAKREKVARHFGGLPKNVSYVEVDFIRDNVGERLASAGYDVHLPSFLILSGVIAYLPEAAVSRLFAFAASHTNPRSSIVFDYIYKEMVDGDDAFHGAAALRRRLHALDEPLHFGIARGTASAFVQRHGLSLVEDAGPDELAARHLRRSDGTLAGRPYGFVAIALGRVTPADAGDEAGGR